ncbi:MAG: 16S rRNA (cytosine(1402)-N(4))-methyltransferase RsmH [Candidatus Colwellbacteria bacterium]|nr:16S rRNA (cytosine(1402)-N(4))-methyltransferase RsmH [Candidatus Colwellbacteria bacterium]
MNSDLTFITPNSRAKLATGQAVKYKSKLKRLILRTGNYADLPKILKEEKLGKIDGVFLDLGFSSEQLESGRGFSFNPPAGGEPLIMTYSKERLPAYRVLKQLNQKELEEIIRTYGEERYAKRIAKAIWERERKEPMTRSGELVAVIRRAVPSSYNRARINPATRTFMAFRIYVNDELGNLEKFLKAIPLVMAKKGRVAIISFHSLEDRTVKNRFRLLVKENKARLLTKKPIIPSKEEIRANPRSRSAKLRAIEFV